jgi:diguanylate cyclase (GGDEF)-like protein/PAS domain S-box-containing protein
VNAARHHPVRLVLVTAALLVCAVLAATAFLIASFRDRTLNDSKRELKNTALIVAEQLDRSFQAIDLLQRSLLDRMAAERITTGADLDRLMSGPDVHKMLLDTISGLAHVKSVALLDADGKLVNLSRDWPIPRARFDQRDYFKALRSSASATTFMSAPARDDALGDQTFYFARKITGPEGAFIGVVVAALDLDYFEKLFGAIALGPGGSVSLYRADGMLLVRHPRPQAGIGQYYTVGLQALGRSNQGTGRYRGQITGNERMLAVHRLTHFPLFVSAARDIHYALASWYQETKVLLGACALIVLTVIAVMLLGARQLWRSHEWSKRQLAIEKQRLDSAVRSMPQGLLLFDSDERLVLCNKSYLDIYGISPDLARPGCTLRELISERRRLGNLEVDVDRYCAQRRQRIREGKPFETTFELPDGRWIRVINHPAEDGGWVSIHEDTTARRLLERERDRDREFLDRIVDNVPTPIMVKSVADWRYVLINGAGMDYLGVPREEVIGKTCRDVWPAADCERIEATDRAAAEEGFLFSDEHTLDTPAKGVRIVTSKRLLIRDAAGAPQYLITVIEDVTERKQSESRIAHLAHHDSLTGLANRVLFHEQLERALQEVRAQGGELALLYFDLDHFKSVNDSLGHSAGDELLKEVAARLRACLSENDFVARLGGDEFAVIQTGFADVEEVTALAKRILEQVGDVYDIAGHQVVGAGTVGVALAPADGVDPDELLKNADLAMYGAKADGRGSYRFFEPAMDARMKERRSLEFDLREAIMCGGFELHYQPLVDFTTGEVTCCEALLRWHHRTRGWIPPADFIPLAEETGLIATLGEWVLRTACAEAANWPARIRLAVNVSPVQFNGGNLVQTVMGALAASQLPAHRLELEITEAVLIRDDALALAVVHQLRALGVRIALDDFGTGYSSLSYLQRFPFDKIKIDRSFIKGIASSDYSRNIVQAIVDIATTRQITTAAEGVETEEQSQILRALGCREMQGYLFSAPVPPDTLELLFLRRPHVARAS